MRLLHLMSIRDIRGFVPASNDDHSYLSVITDEGAVWETFEFDDYALNATYEYSLADTSFVRQKITGYIPRRHQQIGRAKELLASGKFVAIVTNEDNEAFVYGYDEKLKGNAALKPAISDETNGLLIGLEGFGGDIPRQFKGDFVSGVGKVIYSETTNTES